jgi:hypothetical protein
MQAGRSAARIKRRTDSLAWTLMGRDTPMHRIGVDVTGTGFRNCHACFQVALTHICFLAYECTQVFDAGQSLAGRAGRAARARSAWRSTLPSQGAGDTAGRRDSIVNALSP